MTFLKKLINIFPNLCNLCKPCCAARKRAGAWVRVKLTRKGL